MTRPDGTPANTPTRAEHRLARVLASGAQSINGLASALASGAATAPARRHMHAQDLAREVPQIADALTALLCERHPVLLEDLERVERLQAQAVAAEPQVKGAPAEASG